MYILPKQIFQSIDEGSRFTAASFLPKSKSKHFVKHSLKYGQQVTMDFITASLLTKEKHWGRILSKFRHKWCPS